MIFHFNDNIHRTIQSNKLTYFIDANATSEKEDVGCSQISSNIKIFGQNKSLPTENIEDFVGQLSELVEKDGLAHILKKEFY